MHLLVPLAAFLLSTPIQAGNTFVSVNYTLYCNQPASQKPFRFKALLLELDGADDTHDVIEENEGTAYGKYDGYLSGYDTWDGPWNDWYEFGIKISHDCGSDRWKDELKRILPEYTCQVNSDRCIYQQVEEFYLRPE